MLSETCCLPSSFSKHPDLMSAFIKATSTCPAPVTFANAGI